MAEQVIAEIPTEVVAGVARQVLAALDLVEVVPVVQALQILFLAHL
jgi:hypothetical protein